MAYLLDACISLGVPPPPPPGTTGIRVMTSSPESPALRHSTHRRFRTCRPAMRMAWHTGHRCSYRARRRTVG
jgi:hypothetical protein